MTYRDFVVITDVFSISALFTLSIYHLLIYLGRRGFSNEKHNLFFALFSFSLAGYVAVGTLTYLNGFDDFLDRTNMAPPLEGFCLIGIMIGFHKFISPLIELPERKNRIISYILIVYVTVLVMPVSCPVMGIDWYQRHLFFWVLSFVTTCLLITFYLYGSWIIHKRLYFDKAVKLILVGISISIIYLLTSKMILVVDMKNNFAWNNFAICTAVFAFAYAEVVKFNTVHKELIVLKDELEQKVEERTIELHKSIKEIEKISQEKTNYFINLAHETKTPLMLINNYLEKYIRTKGTSKEIELLKQNIDKLTGDMVNFLDAEKLERGQVFYNHDQLCDISELLFNKMLIFKVFAQEKNQMVETFLDPDLFIKADPYAIERILNNLLENAYKYTHDGGKLSVRLNGTGRTVKIEISDNGIGMMPEQMEHIFEPYYQISNHKQNIQGIGMGLYMVKMIVDQLNGNIKVQSREQAGTTFLLSFNRYFSGAGIPKASVSNALNFKLFKADKLQTPLMIDGRYNLLIVEDNSEMLNYLIDELSVDFNVYPSVNGHDALQLINNMPCPEVIVSDIMMDKMDGKTFFSFISKNEKFSHIPFIFISARNIDSERLELLGNGAIDFMIKPFLVAELKAKIKSIIETGSKLRKASLKEMIDIISTQIHLPKTGANDKQSVFMEKCRQFGLTKRQGEIVLCISEGIEHKEIAAKLNISYKTVIRHVQNLYETLHVHNKVELINLLFE